jgi:hypothetical protein
MTSMTGNDVTNQFSGRGFIQALNTCRPCFSHRLEVTSAVRLKRIGEPSKWADRDRVRPKLSQFDCLTSILCRKVASISYY